MQYKPLENTVGKGEIARNEQFLLFPQCFLLENFLPLSSSLKLSSANSFSLEESKICCLERVIQGNKAQGSNAERVGFQSSVVRLKNFETRERRSHTTPPPTHFINPPPFPKQSLVFTYLQYKSFENTVGKGEIASNKQFLLFPQCFLPVQTTFFHFHQM